MNLIVNYASVEDKEKMLLPYYNFYNAFYGPEIVTGAIYKRMSKGKQVGPILEALSYNYQQALYTIGESVENDKDLCLLEIADPEYIDSTTGKPLVLAYARFSWALEYSKVTEFQRPYYEDINEYGVPDYEEDTEETVKERNNKNAGVHDVALAVRMSDDQAAEFYSKFIDALEIWTKERNETIELITHEVPSNNPAYLEAIFQNGEYETVEKKSYPRVHTIMYDKWVRNKPLTRVISPKKDEEK